MAAHWATRETLSGAPICCCLYLAKTDTVSKATFTVAGMSSSSEARCRRRRGCIIRIICLISFLIR